MPSDSKSRVLVVDDMPAVLLCVTSTLQHVFEVTTVRSGEEALRTCQEEGPFAVVLSDEGMPGMGGTEFLAQMQEQHPDTVRIMMSGCADIELAIGALKVGALFRFIQKPFGSEALLEAVRSAAEQHARHAQERFLAKQVEFSRRSLFSLTESLERRLADQLDKTRGLQHFCLELGNSTSLQEVAQLTARACLTLLGSPAVQVSIVDELTGASLEACYGEALDGCIERAAIASAAGEFGEIRLSLANGIALLESEHELLASIASTAANCACVQIAIRSRDLAQQLTITALSSLAEECDEQTGKHRRRMSMYCQLIADGLDATGAFGGQLDASFIKRLVASAPLHDLGKVGIPDAILLKPGPLTESEWKVMRSHTEIGAKSLARMLEESGETSFLRMAQQIAWAHHERWDGSGYPRGLRSEEIPLCARIVALADCYDALTSWRPYKRAWTHAEAMAYITGSSGSHFDPRIVQASQECAHALNQIREELADSIEEVRARRVG